MLIRTSNDGISCSVNIIVIEACCEAIACSPWHNTNGNGGENGESVRALTNAIEELVEEAITFENQMNNQKKRVTGRERRT